MNNKLVSLKAVQGVYDRLVKQAEKASINDDSASAAAFYYACSELERTFPALKQ